MCSRYWSLLLSIALSACGTTVPQIGEPWDPSLGALDGSGVLELAIKDKLYCELRDAVIDVMPSENLSIYRDNLLISPLPDTWGIQSTLNLQVDEATNFTPSVAINEPLRNSIKFFPGFGSTTNQQAYSLGFGATINTQATRIDKYSSYYSVKQLRMNLGKTDSCHYDENGNYIAKKRDGSSLLLISDLGITQWLRNAVAYNNVHISTALTPKADMSFKQDILSYEVKFVIKTEANIAPVWKLVKLSSGQNGTLGATNRLRTHDLLITFGPSNKADGKTGTQFEPSQRALNSHLASEIGLSVASSVRAIGQ